MEVSSETSDNSNHCVGMLEYTYKRNIGIQPNKIKKRNNGCAYNSALELQLKIYCAGIQMLKKSVGIKAIYYFHARMYIQLSRVRISVVLMHG